MNDLLLIIEQALDAYNTYVGTYALMILLVPVGILFTVLLRGIQIRRLGHALAIVRGKYDNPDDPGDINHFQALTAALSVTSPHTIHKGVDRLSLQALAERMVGQGRSACAGVRQLLAG